MDLFAYIQMGDLDGLAKANGIDVPRLRGYRLMKDEKPVDEAFIQECIKAETEYRLESTDRTISAMIEYLINHDLSHIRIEAMDLASDLRDYSRYEERLREQYDMWNKYVGRTDVLMIHSRMGGCTYSYIDKDGERQTYDLRKQPWFLGCVNDAWDGTYVDIYAEIKTEGAVPDDTQEGKE